MQQQIEPGAEQMSATPIVPGLMYEVRTKDGKQIVFATNPVDAICVVLNQQVSE